MSANVEIRPLRREEIEFAAGLIARAFRNLPTSLVTLGHDEVYRLRFLQNGYRRILGTADELPLAAWMGGELVGVCGVQHPGNCKVPLKQKVRLTPFMLWSLKPGAIRRSLQVFAARDEHDLDRPHIHVEPLAVEPAVKSKLIGSRLFQAACDEADRLGLPVFGITEREENVGFFESFGAELLEQFEILGVRNWALCRPAHAAAPDRLREQAAGYVN
ncbi:MAG: GNAT family N-acetyltransferase [Thermoleophilaceae bacterium]